jgi:hypothetical protein
MWPKVPVVPVLQIGASDSLPLRFAGVPSYGVQGMYFDIEDANQQHGPNERVGVREFYEGVEFTNRLMRLRVVPTNSANVSGVQSADNLCGACLVSCWIRNGRYFAASLAAAITSSPASGA